MLKHALGLDAPAIQWQSSEPWVRLGLRSALVMFGGLVLISLAFSITGAVLATGAVTVEGNYKTIQHLDGGIVAKIRVKNGDLVKPGDELIRLEDTSAQVNLSIIMGRMRDLMVQQARLVAERDRQTAFALPEAVSPYAADPQIKEIYASQKSLFDAR